MDKEAFKQRMQSLKSYRELNPGKGYLDWKVQALEDGGKVKATNPTLYKNIVNEPHHHLFGRYTPELITEKFNTAADTNHNNDYLIPTATNRNEILSLRPKLIERIPYKGKLIIDRFGKRYTEDLYYDYLTNSTDEINKFTGNPDVKGLKPAIDIEDMLNLTPVGDAIAVKDTYAAVKENDWLGAALSAAALLPFVPKVSKQIKKATVKGIPINPSMTVHKDLELVMLDRQFSYLDKKKKVLNDALNDRNTEYEDWLDNEDAFKRVAYMDKKYGTNFVEAYTLELLNYSRGVNNDDLTQIGIKPMDYNIDGSFNPLIPNYIFLNDKFINEAVPKGLVNHELGHKIDRLAGVIGLDGKIRKPIFNRNNFESTDRIKEMYPKGADRILKYLLNDSELKSHMNQFRTYLRENNMLEPGGETAKTIKKKLFNSDFDDLKKIFNSYKSGKLFFKDFNNIPLTNNTNKSSKDYDKLYV